MLHMFKCVCGLFSRLHIVVLQNPIEVVVNQVLWSLVSSQCQKWTVFTVDIVLSFDDILLFFWLQVATGQVASTGMVALSYVQKLSEKV